MITEMWLPVKGYEGLYEVSNIGRVRSLYKATRIIDKEDSILRQKFDNRGYFRVNLYKNGKCKAELVSRLVASSFINNPKNLPHVGHWNDDKTNNCVENLYWTDPKENNHHNGKYSRFAQEHNNKIRQIAEKLSIPVIGISKTDGKVVLLDSMQLAKQLGFDPSKISMCINGKRKTHRGYWWERRIEI